jgi:hypothetical protein
MRAPKYPVPECIKGQCPQEKYSRWLHRKAATHARRDRKRGLASTITIARYKARIHDAVCSSGHLDSYTGEPLDWSKISKFDNESAKSAGTKYKKKFALLPTLDHTKDASGQPKFVICSWHVNDAKGDLSVDDFYQLCERVLKHRDES